VTDIIHNLLIDHLEIWTTADHEKKSPRDGGLQKSKMLYGASKLRGLILDLAVSGRLTLEQMDGGLTTRGPLSPIKGAHKFNIPSSWAWKMLKEIGDSDTGKTPPTSNEDFYKGSTPFIGPGQISNTFQIFKAEKFISKEAEKFSSIANPGDVLMVCIGGSIGKTAIAIDRIAINQQINLIHIRGCSSDYVHLCMRASFFQAIIRELSSGSATPIINKSKWESISIPIPPLDIQLNIVKKVDQLMQICDDLERDAVNLRFLQEKLLSNLLEDLIFKSFEKAV
jgi:type I restriction enzyme S subunit